MLLRCLYTLGLAATVAAQGPAPCHAEFDTPVFLDNVFTGGPNMLIGIKMQVTTTVPATRTNTAKRVDTCPRATAATSTSSAS